MDLFFRRAGLHDARTIFEWRNHPLIRQMSSQKKSFSFEQHLAWFEGLLRSDDKYLLIGEYEGNAIGVVRFDCDTDKSASISIYLVPERINTGMGFSLLLAAVDWCWANTQVHSINAVVLQGNVASQKVFEYVGFEKVSEEAYCLTR
jgi:RimJ/RimL family protein N-acetyltransferase